MKMPAISLIEWQKRFGTESNCIKALEKVRWPQGFQCPACGSRQHIFVATRKLYQCSKCRHQVSITADTLFHATKVPLVKWFWAIYLMASDKGGISALRLSKHIGISWISARNILKKIRTAMSHRDSIYRLEKLIEFDDTYVGGKRAGKRGRGAEVKSRCLLLLSL
jgi:DNA-directed RNA polymerase subunit RPC12/RpoP